MERENYFFENDLKVPDDKLFVLIIYDIIDNKTRTKFAKFLNGFGNRVQKSAFEAHLTRKKYEELVKQIPGYCSDEDSIRVYKIIGKGQVTSWGYEVKSLEEDDIILI